jgi:hypothetical protein
MGSMVQVVEWLPSKSEALAEFQPQKENQKSFVLGFFVLFLMYWGFELRASRLLGGTLPLEPLRQP